MDYSEVEEASGVNTMARAFTQFGTPVSKGEYQLGRHPEVAALRRGGPPPVLTDPHADDRTREADALRRREAPQRRPAIGASLIKTKRLIGVLSVDHNRPRN